MTDDAISYFRDIVTTDRRLKELEAFPGKVVGTFCNFVPEEIIYALGALPVRLCSGDADAARSAEEIFPRDTCSLVKSCVGAAAAGAGLFPRLDLLVIPTPCDAKTRLGSVLERFAPVHVLQLPPSKSSPAALDFWLGQVQELVARLEALTGGRLTRPALGAAVELLNHRQRAFRRFLAIRKLVPSVVTGEEALFVTGASFNDDAGRWTLNLEALCVEREERWRRKRAGDGHRMPRLLLAGAPVIYPNFKLARIIESAGAVVAMDDLCSGTQRLYHPTVTRDRSLRSMVRAAAERCLLPPACPCFIEQTDRLNRLQELAEEYQVDGVVYHSLRICPLFDIEGAVVERELKEHGIPCLTLSTDYSQEDTLQIRTRVEAFLEMISWPAVVSPQGRDSARPLRAGGE